MKTYLARCYHKGRAFGTSLMAETHDQAEQYCRLRGWKLEETAARYNPS